MTERELSNLSITILEIIAEQRDIPILLVKGLLQEMNKSMGINVEDSAFNLSVQHLEDEGFIKKLNTKPISYAITAEGKNYL